MKDYSHTAIWALICVPMSLAVLYIIKTLGSAGLLFTIIAPGFLAVLVFVPKNSPDWLLATVGGGFQYISFFIVILLGKKLIRRYGKYNKKINKDT